MRRVRGFTLIELMIVVAVVAIIAAIALGSYQKQVRKSRRAEAKQVLSDLSLREEKFRSNNIAYGLTTTAPPTGIGTANASIYYAVTVTIQAGPPPGFTLTAVPIGDQLKDSCGTLTMTMASGVLTKAPATDCW